MNNTTYDMFDDFDITKISVFIIVIRTMLDAVAECIWNISMGALASSIWSTSSAFARGSFGGMMVRLKDEPMGSCWSIWAICAWFFSCMLWLLMAAITSPILMSRTLAWHMECMSKISVDLPDHENYQQTSSDPARIPLMNTAPYPFDARISPSDASLLLICKITSAMTLRCTISSNKPLRRLGRLSRARIVHLMCWRWYLSPASPCQPRECWASSKGSEIKIGSVEITSISPSNNNDHRESRFVTIDFG